MKKITAGLLAFLMLTGCSNIDNDQTLFVANNKEKYALMDYEGDKQTEFIYDKYEEVGSSGYIVIKDKKYGYLLRDGEEAIKLGKYDKLESIGNMIVGYDKNEKISILDGEGKELYKEDKKTEISLFGLPVIHQGKEYIVLYNDGEVLKKSKEKIISAYTVDSDYAVINFEKTSSIYNLVNEKHIEGIKIGGNNQLMDHSSKKGYLLYNRKTHEINALDLEGKIIFTTTLELDDLYYDKVTVFSKDLTLKSAWFLLKQQNLKSAPILDEHGQLLGLLSTSNIIEGYMDQWDSEVLKKAKTPVENVIDTLEANVIYLNESLKVVEGDIHIAAMSGSEAKKRIHENDVVIVGGDRSDDLEELISVKPSLIVLTGSLTADENVVKKCEEQGISIISTPFNTYQTSQQIVQAIPVEYVMIKGDIKTFSTDDTLDYMKEVMSETRYRGYPVIDLNNRCVGSISRFALLKGLRKKVILVDHNERGQSIPGIEEADILEIVDHHRVADIQTVGPLMFRGEPLGSTATIVTKMFDELDVEMPSHIAGLLLGAVVSDTLLFKSPTCTPVDTKIAKKLAKIAGVDIQEFAMEMFKAGTSLVGKTVDEIFNQDFKKFSFDNLQVGVAQVNSMDIEGFLPYKKDMLDYMNKFAEDNNLEFTLLLLTDIINANSEIFVGGPRPELVEKAFNVQLTECQGTLVGVISRKKQVVPAITAVMSE